MVQCKNKIMVKKIRKLFSFFVASVLSFFPISNHLLKEDSDKSKEEFLNMIKEPHIHVSDYQSEPRFTNIVIRGLTDSTTVVMNAARSTIQFFKNYRISLDDENTQNDRKDDDFIIKI